MMGIDMDTNGMKDSLIRFRRDLHKIPELDKDLKRTNAYLKDHLSKLPCQITDIGKGSFVAFFDAGKDESIAFRTDTDALAITEKPKHDFCSLHSGQMHACGHDGHMSIMLGLAYEVAELIRSGAREEEFSQGKSNATKKGLGKNVLLIFQAAEETIGGAKEICDSGIFEKYNVRKIFGLHIWPDFPKNAIVCRKGAFMAGTHVLWLNIHGKSAHIATPEKGIDALDIGTSIVRDIYRMDREEIPSHEKRVLRFGEFKSGTGVNIISDGTEIGGTLRYYNKDVAGVLFKRMAEILGGYEEKWGCRIEFSKSDGYPPVINPPELVDELETVLGTVTGGEELKCILLKEPFMTAEDYSFYQEKIPGLFFFLGTGLNLPLHNGDYDIDEDVLTTGVKVFKALLLNN